MVGDQDSVLEMSGGLAVGSDGGPLVRKDADFFGSQINHGLDGEGHARFEFWADAAFSKIGNLGIFVETATDAMSNIHGLHSIRRDPPPGRRSGGNNGDDSDDSDDGHANDRYVGGVDSRGGGSGLAVVPPPPSSSDAIFGLAEAGGEGVESSSSSASAARRTITMYRSGFTVDAGPHRRLDDPANAEFLTSLARGRIPRELSREEGGEAATARTWKGVRSPRG